MIFVQILLVGVLLSAVAYWKGEYSKSGGISVRISLSLPFGRRIQEKLTLLTAEMYKLLVMQKGFLLILLFAAFIVNQSDFMNVTNTGYQDLYYDFMEQYEGEPSEESEQYIRSFAKEVNQVSKEYEEAEEQYAQGMLSDDAYIAASMKYESYENEREFLAMIEHQQKLSAKIKKGTGNIRMVCQYVLLPEYFSAGNFLKIRAVACLYPANSSFFCEDRGRCRHDQCVEQHEARQKTAVV